MTLVKKELYSFRYFFKEPGIVRYLKKTFVITIYIFTFKWITTPNEIEMDNNLQRNVNIDICFLEIQVQKEYKKIARRSRWLPECVRVKYGGASSSSTPNQSSSSGNVSSAGCVYHMLSKRNQSVVVFPILLLRYNHKAM